MYVCMKHLPQSHGWRWTAFAASRILQRRPGIHVRNQVRLFICMSVCFFLKCTVCMYVCMYAWKLILFSFIYASFHTLMKINNHTIHTYTYQPHAEDCPAGRDGIRGSAGQVRAGVLGRAQDAQVVHRGNLSVPTSIHDLIL